MRRTLFYTAFLFALVACNKDPVPVPVNNAEPLFFANGNLNNSAFEFKAGLEDYYMFGDYEIFEGLCKFTGDLKEVNALNGQSLRIELYASERLNTNGKINIGESIKDGFFDYKDPDISSSYAALQFNAEDMGPGFSYFWDFGDGNTSNEKNPIHRYARPGFYSVKLTVDDGNGCRNDVVNIIDYFNFEISSFDECRANFSAKNLSGNSVEYNSSNAVADMYYWDFGDGETSLLKDPVHTYANPGVYTVNHIIYNNTDSCVAEYSRNISTESSSSCIANFSIKKVTVPSNNIDLLSKVVVIWTEANGQEYRSDGLIQDEDAYFEIHSAVPYKKNEKGLPTYRLGIKLNCKVFNENADIKFRLTDVEGRIAVAHPEFN